jgi:hypothetical protein
MSSSMYMGFDDAATAIGEALLALAPEGVFEHRLYPYPGFLNPIIYTPGKPSIICKWEAIAEDKASENYMITIPSAFRYELRILHRSDYPPEGSTDVDPYALAQQMVQKGTGAWFGNLNEDRTLGNLILDCGVEASFSGDLIDEGGSGETLYGHQMIVTTKNWN